MNDLSLDTLRRKRDQEWELAGLARQDGDKADEARHTDKAREYAAEIGRRVRGET
jgi:hypothetical protein